MNNPLHQLHALGQSVWLDYIRRGILDDGSLERMIEEHGLRGVTSNPSIFEQAMAGSNDYDDEFEEMANSGLDASAAYERLAIEDIQRTADLFLPVYDGTGGHDGFVSLEVSPTLAHDTYATLAAALRLWAAVDRPNAMIKIPGTTEGIPAIEQALAEGININVTLLFSRDMHEQVMRAYIRGLEHRLDAGEPVDRVASVTSFFVSRVDTAIDAALERSGHTELQGKAAVANAKLAYARFREIFDGADFRRLRDAGARVQRPLWASTSTKNPAYRDVIYVEELIGPDTVNTMPLATVEAFGEHGVAKRTLDTDLQDAEQVLEALHRAGVELDQVTDKLQKEGVDKFAESFEKLIASVGEKLERVAGRV
ncbi:hypothetical protein BH20GEM3_BH20GEM3_03480 [soil metagenome]